MGKSTKSTVSHRTDVVLKLILAGGEYADIRQYASAQGWDVGPRQIRRYIAEAHRRFAKATVKDRKQLLGRHLMQRRTLFARAIKSSDLKTALQIIRDEAMLEGLYPHQKGSTSPDIPERRSSLTVRERLVRWIAAENKGDVKEIRIIDELSPNCTYTLPDTHVPYQILQSMALIHVSQILDHAAMMGTAMFLCVTVPEEMDSAGRWDSIALANAYMFRVRRDGWRLFTQQLGVDGDKLLAGNYQGNFLGVFEERFDALAPSVDELKADASRNGISDSSEPRTAESEAKQWWRLFNRANREQES